MRNTRLRYRRHQDHRGEAVTVGRFWVLAGGTMYLQPADLDGVEALVCLRSEVPESFLANGRQVIHYPIPDFSGAPDNWEEFLRRPIVPLLESGKKVLVFCAGSHGRTGCFLASLIAILENPAETPDPIAAVRQRHCQHAVETYEQAKAIFALRGQGLPAKYRREFRLKAGEGESNGNEEGQGY